MALFDSIKSDVKQNFGNGNVLFQLITINVAAFIVLLIIRFAIMIGSSNTLAAAENFDKVLLWLGMSMKPMTFLPRFYTIISYQFIHADIFHLFWNMLFLYWFGSILQSYIGNKKTLALYLYGGICGGLLALGFASVLKYVPAFATMPSAEILVGASAGIWAIIAASATLAPDHPVFLFLIGEVRLKYVVGFLLLLDLAVISFLSNAGGSVSHMGGAAFGYIFVRQLQNGIDWSIGLNRFFDWISSLFERRNNRYLRAEVNPYYEKKTKAKTNTEKRIDDILDKINRSGYDSLNKDEKEFLFKYSKDS